MMVGLRPDSFTIDFQDFARPHRRCHTLRFSKFRRDRNPVRARTLPSVAEVTNGAYVQTRFELCIYW